jgi:hypothetical protein
MTPDKWKVLMDDAHLVEKPFLHIYRLYLKYPWWVFAFWFTYCVGAFVNIRRTLDNSGEFLSVLIFIVGVGPVFFFFGLKAMTWMLLRICGFRSEDLRIE